MAELLNSQIYFCQFELLNLRLYLPRISPFFFFFCIDFPSPFPCRIVTLSSSPVAARNLSLVADLQVLQILPCKDSAPTLLPAASALFPRLFPSSLLSFLALYCRQASTTMELCIWTLPAWQNAYQETVFGLLARGC
jgi:hypothetical protein